MWEQRFAAWLKYSHGKLSICLPLGGSLGMGSEGLTVELSWLTLCTPGLGGFLKELLSPVYIYPQC